MATSTSTMAEDTIVESQPAALADYAKTKVFVALFVVWVLYIYSCRAQQGTLNLISRKSNLSGPQNIVAQGRCIIRDGATIRGDIAKVEVNT
jgi:hypothetical protein